jgi:hypothetical protein
MKTNPLHDYCSFDMVKYELKSATLITQLGARTAASYITGWDLTEGLGLAIVYLSLPLRPDVLTPLAEALAEVN